MLNLRFPRLKSELKQASIGLWPARLPKEAGFLVLAKLPKQCILTAVDQRSLKMYFVPLEVRGVRLLGVTTAFFDDVDEPMVVRTLLFDDELSSALLAAMLEPRLRIYFFDDHGRELAGFTCEVTDPAGLRERIHSFDRSPPDLDVMADAYDAVVQWFSHRSDDDDARAFHLKLDDELFPSDLFTIDFDQDLGGFAGAPLVAYHSLVQENAGRFQEPDILRALQRIFSNEQLSMNPMRADKPGKEFADALVVTPTHIVIVQAKDSPNTPAMLDRTLSRKRATGHHQLTEAAKQLQGAISYCRRGDTLPLIVAGTHHVFPVAGKTVIGIMVLRELFPDETSRHLDAIAQVRKKTGVDAILLDYTGLALLTFHSPDVEAFLGAVAGLSGEAKAGRYSEVTSYVLRQYVSSRGRRIPG